MQKTAAEPASELEPEPEAPGSRLQRGFFGPAPTKPAAEKKHRRKQSVPKKIKMDDEAAQTDSATDGQAPQPDAAQPAPEEPAPEADEPAPVLL